MQTMKVEKAEKLGLCFGVKRAIKLLSKAVSQYGKVETLGPLAHNRLLVESLANLGIEPIADVDQTQAKTVAITTHGASPEVLSKLRGRGVHVIDTTCPIVRKAQEIARQLAESGFDVVIFGDANHSEVKGLLGWTQKRGTVALSPSQIDWSAKSPSHVAIISQTTQRYSAFIQFARELLNMIGQRIEEMRLVNTLCKITQAQQQAAMELAAKTELMIVIGGRNSANTRHLVEICSPIVETRWVETAEEVDGSWLAGKHHVGVTAGASTPDEAVKELIARLRSF